MAINVDGWLKYIENEIKKADTITFKSEEERQVYVKKLTSWLSEVVVKNSLIKGNPKREKVNRIRQNVYWIDFGFNIGTEFNFPHFCVVIKEFNNTAVVVPISSEKEDDSEWKNAGNLFIPIGKLNDLPGAKRDCYALVNQIRTVSKQRLSDYYDKSTNKHVSIMLDYDQMKLIMDAIKRLGEQPIKTRKSVEEDVEKATAVTQDNEVHVKQPEKEEIQIANEEIKSHENDKKEVKPKEIKKDILVSIEDVQASKEKVEKVE